MNASLALHCSRFQSLRHRAQHQVPWNEDEDRCRKKVLASDDWNRSRITDPSYPRSDGDSPTTLRANDEIRDRSEQMPKSDENNASRGNYNKSVLGDILFSPRERGRDFETLDEQAEELLEKSKNTCSIHERMEVQLDSMETSTCMEEDVIHQLAAVVGLDETESSPVPVKGLHGDFSRNKVQSQSPQWKRRSALKKTSSYGNPPSISPSPQELKRTVGFGTMQIRQYNVALSDHPFCSSGPPIQLSWEYKEQESVPVASYEEARETTNPRRRGSELLLSLYERHVLLVRQAGYSKQEIKQTMKEVERVKRERMTTDLFLPTQCLNETVEEVVKAVKGVEAYFENALVEDPRMSATV